MDRGTFRILRIGGIDIKIHWSWILILLVLTFSLAASEFPRRIPGETAAFYWIVGTISALMLFVSVLLHELAHSFAARGLGLKVRDIVLFIFGGVSNIEQEPKKARDEFIIAFVGPLTSFALAGIFYLLWKVVDPSERRFGNGVAVILQYLAFINLILGLFNMIPGFPLDGGRVLRSIIWGFNRDFQAATRIAGFIGQLVAYAFIAWGIIQVFFLDNLGGLWTAFIGWFLLNAAQQSVAGTTLREKMRGVSVGQLMQPPPPAASPNMTLAHLLSQYVIPYNLRVLPVAQDGRLAGIITLTDIKEVPQEEWGMATVGQVMTGPDELRTVTPQDPLERAMELLMEGDFDQLPVVDPSDPGRLVGFVSRAQLLRWLQIREELKLQRAAKA